MKIRENKLNKPIKHLNKFTFSGTILSNDKNKDFGDSLYALYPFNNRPIVPLIIESSTNIIELADDLTEDTKKNIINANIYDSLIDKVVDNDDFYIGCRVKIFGHLISKNFFKIEERVDIFNICNRYKNLVGTRPTLGLSNKKYFDKENEVFLDKYLIDWNALLSYGLLENIPDEEDQENGRVEYFFTENGTVFRQEFKTNYLVIVESITKIEDFVDTAVGDINEIELIGNGKDIFVTQKDNYQFGHICMINKSDKMTRDSYIHCTFVDGNLDKILKICTDDNIYVRGTLKHRIIDKSFMKKKGKKEFLISKFINLYEVHCKEISIFKK